MVLVEFRYRHHHLSTHDLTLHVGVGVVLEAVVRVLVVLNSWGDATK